MLSRPLPLFSLPLALSSLLLAGCSLNGPPVAGSSSVSFAYSACLGGCGLDQNAIAAGGASTGIAYHLTTPATTTVTGARSSDENIVRFALDLAHGSVVATSGAPGRADLILDGKSGEIGRGTVRVQAANLLAIDNAWGMGAATILAGTPQQLHATTEADGSVLLGTGAVKWSYAGTLTGMPASSLCFGDCGAFSGTPGAGTVMVDAVDAHAKVAVTVVDAAAITTIDAEPPSLSLAAGATGGTVVMTARAGTTPVFGAHCQWLSQPAGLDFTATQTSSLGVGASESWSVSGGKGNYTATCTVGGASKKVSVTVQ